MVIAGASALVGALTGGAITLEVVRGNDKMQMQVTPGEARHD